MKLTAKTITFLITTLVAINSIASVETETKEFIISNENRQTTVALNLDTVRCSHIGYGLSELKISVPDLKWMALFDHSNIGEVEPCMTAGACSSFNPNVPSQSPADIIDIDIPEQEITVNIKLSEKYFINHTLKTCERSLNEDLKAQVRGKKFTHHRGRRLGKYPYEACLKLP